MHRDPVAIDLGLQGGGAHGAFTWGVLDRLLEEPWLTFDGVSGTSAGAMNAVVMADGLTEGGPRQARVALDTRPDSRLPKPFYQQTRPKFLLSGLMRPRNRT